MQFALTHYFSRYAMGRQSAVYRSTYYNVVVQSDIKIEAFERTWNVYIPSPPSHSLLCNLLARAAVERAAATPQQIEPPAPPSPERRERGRETETSDSERERTYVRRRGAPRPLFLPLARARRQVRPPALHRLCRRRKNSRFHLEMRQALPPSPPHSGDGRRAGYALIVIHDPIGCDIAVSE